MARHHVVTRSLLLASMLAAAVSVPLPAHAQDSGLAPPAPDSAPDGAPDAAPDSVPPDGSTAAPSAPEPVEPRPADIDLGVPPPAPVPAPEGKPKPAEGVKLQIASANGEHKVEFHGLVAADGRFFLKDKNGVSTFLVRRARPIIEAKVFKYYEFNLQAEFASSKFQILDGYGNVHIWDAFQLRIGKGKAPVGLERLQSPRDTFFPEPAFPTQLVPNRDVGAMLHGKIAAGTFEYQLGVFNGVPNGQSGETDTNDSKDVDGRIFLLPFLPTDIAPLKGLGVGVAGTIGNEQGPVGPYVTSGQATFFSYGSTVNGLGRRWLVTPQAYYYFGPVGAMWELVRVRETFATPTGTGHVGTTAWALQGSVAVGGKQSFKGLKVTHALDPANGYFGAFEVGGRFGDLRVGDGAFIDGFARRASSAQRATQAGVVGTWHLADGNHVRVSYERTHFRGGAADGGNKDAESLLLARLQASF